MDDWFSTPQQKAEREAERKADEAKIVVFPTLEVCKKNCSMCVDRKQAIH